MKEIVSELNVKPETIASHNTPVLVALGRAVSGMSSGLGPLWISFDEGEQ